MRRAVLVAALAVIAFAPLVSIEGVSARSSQGTAGGSRASRDGGLSSGSSSGRWSSGESATAPSWSPSLRPPRRPTSWVRTMGRLVAGGLLGSLLLGGPWRGGLSLLDVIVLSGLIYVAFRGLAEQGTEPATSVASTATLRAPAGSGDSSRRATRIHDIEPNFDARRFGEMVVDVFVKLQAAWTARDSSSVADVVTPGMKSLFARDCDRMRADRRINRLERFHIRQAHIAEAWREGGHDYVIVRLAGTLVDYTTDDEGTVVDGNAVEPVDFDEKLTFVRPTGLDRWQLSSVRHDSSAHGTITR